MALTVRKLILVRKGEDINRKGRLVDGKYVLTCAVRGKEESIVNKNE